MPILTEDIKLLKSAVMADVPEGGGAMTGIAVIDGQSNNLFPDTSAMDRALGRVNARKVFGAAHTEDTDTLMGAHAIVTQAPADPLVHCTLIETANWGDRRVQAKDAIEKYLVKGPRIAYTLYDTHYAGSQFINLVAPATGVPPVGGDSLVLVNPNGDEQYVRLLKVTTTIRQVLTVNGQGEVVLVSASVASCTITTPLVYDFLGPAPLTVVSSAFAKVYGTNIAAGAKFHGIKALATAGAPGDYSVTVAGGIYTPVVPAATVESPIIDQYPIKDRKGLADTALASITLDSVAFNHSSGNTLTAPTPIYPGSVNLVGSAGTFTDDKTGILRNGTLAVGTVDYQAGTLTFGSTSPAYGTAATVLTYTPGTLADLAAQSSSFDVTLANQGRAYVNVFEPLPAPGSFTLSFMAQGKWYDLKDNMNGKLVGADSSYGTGTIDYLTGSMAVTLGALPDVNSPLVADWGEQAAATPVAIGRLPAKLGTRLPINPGTSHPFTLAWSRGGVNYSATMGTTGLLTGDATGSWQGGKVIFEPDVFPDGAITVTSDQYGTAVTAATNPVAYQYQADAAALPIAPGTFSGTLAVTSPAGALWPATSLALFDRNGVVYARYHGNKEDGIANNGSEVLVGGINYASGSVTLNPTAPLYMWFFSDKVPSGAWRKESYKNRVLAQVNLTIASFGALTAPSFHTGTVTTSTYTQTVTSVSQPVGVGTWTAVISTQGTNMLLNGLAFKLGADNYTSLAGTLRRGWNPVTALPVTGAAGVVDSDGLITVADFPSNFQNGITWINAVQDAAARLTRGGVFRTSNAPLKQGVMQVQAGARVASANESGVLSGSNFGGSVDFQRGVVKWESTVDTNSDLLSYNAVFLQYLPLDASLLGIDTVRLPLDGKVPVLRTGDLMVVHNTLTTALPNPLVKGTVYSLGRERIASVRVKDALGVVVPSSLYVSDLNPGTIVFPVPSDLTPYSHPFAVEHRIEDMLVCSQADISGQLTFTSRLTHNFSANTSFVSSALTFGDLFARTHNYIEQSTWSGTWSDALIGSAPLSNFNESQYAIAVTNRGAITERWAIIFTSGTGFKVVGESVGEIGNGNTATDCALLNPATAAPYFTLPALGWGSGWSAGNVLRFNTAACGAPFWIVRTVLQGPASVDSDVFSIAFRSDVDRP